jgi:hypothetical protein
MAGYLGAPDKTKEGIDDEGVLHSGYRIFLFVFFFPKYLKIVILGM